jgi:heparosan-N-sulfate-glucuronate 5-epimerase
MRPGARADEDQPRGRPQAGLFSSARTLVLPVSERLQPGALRGYPIDFRTKARAADELPSWRLPAAAIQWALGCYERWLAGEGEVWLHAATSVAEQLVARQQRSGRHEGGWLHDEPLEHTYQLAAPWLSALPQGEGASLLVRVHQHTGEEHFADAARRALNPLQRPVAGGGVFALLDGAPFPEEYPTDPPSYVLNGAVFALWGIHDVALAFNDGSLRAEFEQRVDALARSIHRWDTGRWSLYDLFPHPVPNVASSAYHALHINQLQAMNILAPRPSLASAAERFTDYAASRAHRTEAFVRKVAFRLIVPRNPVLTRLMARVTRGGRE